MCDQAKNKTINLATHLGADRPNVLIRSVRFVTKHVVDFAKNVVALFGHLIQDNMFNQAWWTRSKQMDWKSGIKLASHSVLSSHLPKNRMLSVKWVQIGTERDEKLNGGQVIKELSTLVHTWNTHTHTHTHTHTQSIPICTSRNWASSSWFQ